MYIVASKTRREGICFTYSCLTMAIYVIASLRLTNHLSFITSPCLTMAVEILTQPKFVIPTVRVTKDQILSAQISQSSQLRVKSSWRGDRLESENPSNCLFSHRAGYHNRAVHNQMVDLIMSLQYIFFPR